MAHLPGVQGFGRRAGLPAAMCLFVMLPRSPWNGLQGEVRGPGKERALDPPPPRHFSSGSSHVPGSDCCLLSGPLLLWGQPPSAWKAELSPSTGLSSVPSSVCEDKTLLFSYPFSFLTSSLPASSHCTVLTCGPVACLPHRGRDCGGSHSLCTRQSLLHCPGRSAPRCGAGPLWAPTLAACSPGNRAVPLSGRKGGAGRSSPEAPGRRGAAQLFGDGPHTDPCGPTASSTTAGGGDQKSGLLGPASGSAPHQSGRLASPHPPSVLPP